ncbi:hypothetical protein ACFUCH_35545 [Streptomyces olivaceus]|uniref:hypothetical protein n=1 Tax=Streptomyces olivaceus TaxID=47716 RepID=UPI00363F6185
MKTLRAFACAATVTVLAGGTVAAAPASSTAAPSAAAACATKWKVKAKVAVRRPAPNEGPVATTRTRVHHYLYKGDVVKSCVTAVGRTANQYRACGKSDSLWQIVPGGQVPKTCLKRQ